MVTFHYRRWDGTQEPFEADADDLLGALAEGLFEHGDLTRALHDFFRVGMRGPRGQHMPGLRDLARELRERRQQRLGRYDLDSVTEDLRRRLDRVVELEWEGAERAAAEEEGRQRAEATRRLIERLPPSLGGAIRALAEHDFIDPLARQEFANLLGMLRQHMMGSLVQQATESFRGMRDEGRETLREMLQAVNQMLRDRLQGRSPDFRGFIDRFEALFGRNPPRNLDELVDAVQHQLARAESLLSALSPDRRRELEETLEELLDPETRAELVELGALMRRFPPPSDFTRHYAFEGEEALTLGEAMRVMGELQELDALEQALQQAERTGNLTRLDGERVGELLGPGAERALRALREVAQKLEERGYARRGGDGWTLTVRTIRKLGEKALSEVFGRLKGSRVGGHRSARVGTGGEPTGDARAYEPGDPFDLNLCRSLTNAVVRRGPGTPVRLRLEDIEVNHLEATVSAATALLLDQSSSMFYQGRWPSAKKVALALQALIQGQFPRDRLFYIGFSDYAHEIKTEDLPTAEPNMWQQGTNMHHALMLARRRLAREPAATRQIIMVTDGDPTAHLAEGVSCFSYPPTRRTVSETLKEVKRCASAGILVNTFMLARTPYLVQFVDYVTRINRGRAFFASPERLGDYLVVDYVQHRRRRVG